MVDDLADLLDTAMYKEIASHAFYVAEQRRTQDPGARALMKELAEQELKHSEWVKGLKEKGLKKQYGHQTKVSNLMISEYLTSSDTIEGAGLQDTLTFAIKREQQAIEFYSKMMSVMKDRSAKRLCQRLTANELRHKLKLEIFYDDLFYGED